MFTTELIYIGHMHATHVHIGIIIQHKFSNQPNYKSTKVYNKALDEQFVKFTLSENKAKVTNLIGNLTIYI